MRHTRDMGVTEVEVFCPCWSMWAGDQPPHTTMQTFVRTKNEQRRTASGWLAQRLSNASAHHKRTGIPRSFIRALACCTVYSP
jgi:hypothetical protein